MSLCLSCERKETEAVGSGHAAPVQVGKTEDFLFQKFFNFFGSKIATWFFFFFFFNNFYFSMEKCFPYVLFRCIYFYLIYLF